MCLSPERAEDALEQSDCLSPKNDYDDDDDIIIISSEDKQKRRPPKPEPRTAAREISLKFRWRTDVFKVPVLSTDRLYKAVEQLSAKLKVLPSQILLLRQDTELAVDCTASELGLGIADIIDCVVITEDKEESNSRDVITLRLQGQEKGSAQEYSLHKDAPLGSILSQYTSGLSAIAKRRVKFLFDGSKVTPSQTPSQLDMENGDVIEVWT
uniref:NFATC2-interacting protein n=2 Tax=Pygocentrus nattereri TaxID=42514 RepID=A0A3B4CCN3_PYGNA